MQEKMIEICQELCCKEVAADEELIVSGLLDSFKIMELICTLEEQFHIVFLPEEIMNLDNFSTINRMTEIVSLKAGGNV